MSLQRKCSQVYLLFLSSGCTGLRSTPWPTSCSCRQPPASRAPSRPSARGQGGGGRGGGFTKRGEIYRRKGRGHLYFRMLCRWPLPIAKTIIWFRLEQMKTKCKDSECERDIKPHSRDIQRTHTRTHTRSYRNAHTQPHTLDSVRVLYHTSVP